MTESPTPYDAGEETLKRGEWQPIETAPKDGRYILALYRATDDHRAYWNGRAFVVRHEGTTASDFDLGWSLFPGFGGVSDRSLSHWMPLPEAP